MWRHMALQFDERSNKINFFLDGVLAISDESPMKVMRDTDQVTPDGFDTALMLGHADPGYRCASDRARLCDGSFLRFPPSFHLFLSPLPFSRSLSLSDSLSLSRSLSVSRSLSFFLSLSVALCLSVCLSVCLPPSLSLSLYSRWFLLSFQLEQVTTPPTTVRGIVVGMSKSVL